jgi:transposase
MTDELSALSDWLASQAVVRVAMESTGVYWKPIFNLLEARFPVMLANARHIKQVPGRKTDVKDCQWIAQLLQYGLYGLLRPSFIPPLPIRELRDRTRQRTQLIRERVSVSNRVEKVLEDANIKSASVATEVLGKSGRAMIRALIGGETGEARLAEMARSRLRSKIPQLKRAPSGQVTEHHRYQLKAPMEHVAHLEGLIRQIGGRVALLMTPYADQPERPMTIPGIDRQAAEAIVAEVGVDMSRSPAAGHLCSWAGVAPGNSESAGRRRTGRTSEANRWLRPILVQVARAAGHTKATLLSATYRRWAKRIGKERAPVGRAHEVLKIVHEVLKGGATYEERLAPEPVV